MAIPLNMSVATQKGKTVVALSLWRSLAMEPNLLKKRCLSHQKFLADRNKVSLYAA
jgi:hypothetical protein